MRWFDSGTFSWFTEQLSSISIVWYCLRIMKNKKTVYIEKASARKVGAACPPELIEGLTAKSNAAAGSRFHQNLSNGHLGHIDNREIEFDHIHIKLITSNE